MYLNFYVVKMFGNLGVGFYNYIREHTTVH